METTRKPTEFEDGFSSDLIHEWMKTEGSSSKDSDKMSKPSSDFQRSNSSGSGKDNVFEDSLGLEDEDEVFTELSEVPNEFYLDTYIGDSGVDYSLTEPAQIKNDSSGERDLGLGWNSARTDSPITPVTPPDPAPHPLGYDLLIDLGENVGESNVETLEDTHVKHGDVDLQCSETPTDTILHADPSKTGTKFEQATETGELPSPTGPTPDQSHEPMSLKEELADREEEKDGVSVDDEDSEVLLDTVADLDFVSANARQWESPLNVEASKQRAQLRQRGSLAKRRKPTRASVRSTSRNEEAALDNRGGNINCHVAGEELPSSDSSRSSSPSPSSEGRFRSYDEHQTNIDMCEAMQGLTLGTGVAIHGIKTAIVKPQDIEIRRNRLRSIPMTASSESRPQAPEVKSPSTPPWLREARFRKANRAPKGEAEKLKQEKEPEKPAWMKDAGVAISKRKQSATRMQTENGTAAPKADTSSPAHVHRKSSSTSAVPSFSKNIASPTNPNTEPVIPWMHETYLRKSNRSKSTSVTPKEFANNMNSLIADSLKSENSSDASQGVSDDVRFKEDGTTAAVKSSDRSGSKYTAEPKLLDNVSLPLKSSHSKESVVLSPISPSSTNEQETPAWKAEVALRRKNKPAIVPQKVEQPMKLGEVPQWKKDLLQKNKQRRVSDGSESTSDGHQGMTADRSLPPWKLEMDKRKKRQSAAPRIAFNDPSADKKAPEEESEWAHLVEVRRKKLARIGLLEQGGSSKTE